MVKDMTKRIKQLIARGLQARFDSPDKMLEKIQEITEIMKLKSQVGEGIKTYRWFQGEASEVEQSTGNFLINKSAEQQEEEVISTGDGEDSGEEKLDEHQRAALKTRRAFKQTLNDQNVLPSVKKLNYFANLILLVLLVLAIVEYASVNSDYNRLKDMFLTI